MFEHKAVLKSVTFLWKEGLIADDNTPITFTTWWGANAQLRRWAKHAPKGGGYDKTKFVVTWSDGEEYTGRFDLQREHATGHSLLQDWMRDYVEFQTGLHCPAHLKPADYQEYTKDPVARKEAVWYLASRVWFDMEANDDAEREENLRNMDYWWWEDHNEYPAIGEDWFVVEMMHVISANELLRAAAATEAELEMEAARVLLLASCDFKNGILRAPESSKELCASAWGHNLDMVDIFQEYASRWVDANPEKFNEYGAFIG